jgi:hypothetical protein
MSLLTSNNGCGRAQAVLVTALERAQARAAKASRGHERLVLTEIFRALDMCAFAFKVAPNRVFLASADRARWWMLHGAAAALSPFLKAVEGLEGPMPWGPSTPAWTRTVEAYLLQCGYLAWLHRLAGLERYGLTRTTFTADDRLVIEVAGDEMEAADREAQAWLAIYRLESAGLAEPLA